jgi:hypothetical protein
MGKAILYRSVCKAALSLLAITNLAVGQSFTPNVNLFAGCYEVTSLSWKPSGEEIGPGVAQNPVVSAEAIFASTRFPGSACGLRTNLREADS